MKISQSASYFLLILISMALVLTWVNKKDNQSDKILLQTLACQSDKIDRSILNLNAKTSLIGAYISFDKVPISEADRNQLNKYKVVIDEKSWFLNYAQAQIPTNNLCALVQEENILRIYIPQFN